MKKSKIIDYSLLSYDIVLLKINSLIRYFVFYIIKNEESLITYIYEFNIKLS